MVQYHSSIKYYQQFYIFYNFFLEIENLQIYNIKTLSLYNHIKIDIENYVKKKIQRIIKYKLIKHYNILLLLINRRLR